MPAFTAQNLARWTGGQWTQEPKAAITGVSHDTRTLSRGNLYIAVAGDRVDGHDFVMQAIEKGAAAVMINRDFAAACPSDHPALLVDHTRPALTALARGYRQQSAAFFIGITGSVGKTTVKEMVAEVLATGSTVSRTLGNWNNDLGLPLSLLSMEPDSAYGVYEVGMNHPGELKPLCEVLEPQAAVLTEVGSAHCEFFDSEEAIAEEKATLVQSVPETGFVVLDAGSPWFSFMKERSKARVVTVALDDPADYTGIILAYAPDQLEVYDRKTECRFLYTMPLPGRYIRTNALLAIAVGRERGLAHEEIFRAIAGFRPLHMRWQEIEKAGVLFINDAYNANPLSMRAALSAFAEMPRDGRKWLALGGMYELGARERSEHVVLGEVIAGGDWAGLVTCTPLGSLIAEGARAAGWGEDRLIQGRDTAEAAHLLHEHLKPGDGVLCKASRGERFENIIEEF